MKKTLIIALVIIGILVIGGVYFIMNQKTSNPINTPTRTNNNPSTNSPASTQPQTHDISISGFTFSPSSLTIKKGDTVTWTNQDSAVHTVTSDTGGELASNNFGKGQTYSHTFNTAGTFAYHCNIHPSMKAKIIVE